MDKKKVIGIMSMLAVAQLIPGSLSCAQRPQRTYCNPVNIDYGYTPIPRFTKWGKHRTTADPAIVLYRDDLYLFSTNQEGYWWSHDMLHWQFIRRSFLKFGGQSFHGANKLCGSGCAIHGQVAGYI